MGVEARGVRPVRRASPTRSPDRGGQPPRPAGSAPRGEAGRPEVVLGLGPSSLHSTVRSWFTPVAASKASHVLEPAHLEVGGEGTGGQPATGAQRPRHAGEHRRSDASARPGPPRPSAWQSEMAASNSRRTRAPGVALAERHPSGVPAGDLDEAGRHVHADDLDAPPPEGVGVTAGAAAHVEHPVPSTGRARPRGRRPPARCPLVNE